MAMSTSKLPGYFASIISAILMGMVGIFVRRVSIHGYDITFARFLLGLIFLLVFLIVNKSINEINLKNFSIMLIPTGILMSAGISCYINAISYTSLSTAVFLLYAAPPLAVIIAVFFLKEKLTFFNVLSLMLAVLGLILLLDIKSLNGSRNYKGYLWGLGSSFAYAFYLVFNRKIPEKITLLSRSFYQLLIGSITLLPFVNISSILLLQKRELFWLILMGFLQGFLAFILLVQAIKKIKTVEYATLSYIEPITASLIGFVFYNEKLLFFQIVGAFLVVLGGILQIFTTSMSKPKKCIKHRA